MHVHIDMLGGIAGDMFLAAAIDAGLVDLDALQNALGSLGVGAVTIETERVRRGAIAGTHAHFDGWDERAEKDHRHLSNILKMLEKSDLEPAVKARARQMFETLGASEAKIHEVPIDEIHFHECGALDSIFDFVSAAFIIETSGASWSFGPVPYGHGTVETDHGVMPLPAPATADLLTGLEMVPREVERELVTPTGATILKTLRRFNPSAGRPPGVFSRVGYGAGSRQLDGLSNVVRFLVLDDVEKNVEPTRDVVCRITCEIDDMNPEWYPDVEERLFDSGALDVVREPIFMKKGRQGTRLSVLCDPERQDALAERVLRETTTFGVRIEQVERLKLVREIVQVELESGSVGIKVGYVDGAPIKFSPEYDDCARLAKKTGRTVREIYEEAVAVARERIG